VAGGRLVLVFVDLAAGVLGDHGGVVGADHATGVQILDHLVVILAGGFVGVGGDEDKRAVGAGHGSPPRVVADDWTSAASQGHKRARLIA